MEGAGDAPREFGWLSVGLACVRMDVSLSRGWKSKQERTRQRVVLYCIVHYCGGYPTTLVSSPVPPAESGELR